MNSVQIERQGAIAVIRMAHGKANALDVALCQGLSQQFDSLERDACRAVVLTGAGNIFSAGIDLPQLIQGGADYAEQLISGLHHLLETVFYFPKPIIAAVNGHAIAGGCVLACACDYRVLGPGRIGIPELLVGVPFPALALEIMRFTAAGHRFSSLVYRGTVLEGAAAVEAGLADELTDASSLMTRALERAGELARIPSEAFQLTKEQLRIGVRNRVAESSAKFGSAVREFWTRKETLQSIQAYAQRTLRK